MYEDTDDDAGTAATARNPAPRVPAGGDRDPVPERLAELAERLDAAIAATRRRKSH